MSGAARRSSDLVDRVLASAPPATLYQPVVDLGRDNTPVVGFEALARWPELDDVSTGELFAEADRTMRIAELDWACRTSAVRSVLAAGIDRSTAIFINAEPVSAVRQPPPGERALWRHAARERTLVLELTERELLTNVPALLASVEDARRAGWWIALDDVGVNPDSLAMLEFIRPDMVKLDLGFVQGDIDADAARTLRGVHAYCERTGALVLAEGIETEAHLERAIAVGASLGQGYLFGRAGALYPSAAPFRANRVPPIHPAGTPYELLTERRGYRIARKQVLRTLTDDLERQVSELEDPPAVLTTVPPASPAAAVTAARYSRLAEHSPLVLVLGAAIPEHAPAGVHGLALAADDPLRREWAMVILGPHAAMAAAAQDLGDTDCADDDRRLRFVMTQDRDLAVAAGLALLDRLVEAGSDNY